MSRVCAICGAAPATLGLRLPGPRSALPQGKRGYGWACSEACLAVLQERRARVTGEAPAAVGRPSDRQAVLL